MLGLRAWENKQSTFWYKYSLDLKKDGKFSNKMQNTEL
jgi:hypothetical protein